jgi:DNA-binding response OmpR family regulator
MMPSPGRGRGRNGIDTLFAAIHPSMPIPDPTIFVADDNVAILQGLKRALSATGYTVETAENGRAALELLRAAPEAPDLLLLDVMMPEVNGFEVLEAMRADARLADVPVLLITATTDGSVAELVQRDPSLELLAKPFRLDQLLARVAAHLERWKTVRGAASSEPLRGGEAVTLAAHIAHELVAAQRLVQAGPAPLPSAN